jgi:hypothetical protein
MINVMSIEKTMKTVTAVLESRASIHIAEATKASVIERFVRTWEYHKYAEILRSIVDIPSDSLNR